MGGTETSRQENTNISCEDGITKIEAVFEAVVEFIKWYNKQNQKT